MHLAWRIYRQPILRYGVVGGTAAIIDIGFFYLFAKLLHYPYFWVSAVGFILATFVNYLLCVRYVFAKHRHRSTHSEFLLVYLVSLAGLALHQTVLFLMIETVHTGLMTAKLTATALVFFWNYLLRKKLIFAPGR